MYEWYKQIQTIIDEIDTCIRQHADEAMTLHALAKKLGYEFSDVRSWIWELVDYYIDLVKDDK